MARAQAHERDLRPKFQTGLRLEGLKIKNWGLIIVLKPNKNTTVRADTLGLPNFTNGCRFFSNLHTE